MKTVKEPTYPAILHFVSDADDGTEYIVIATEGPIREHAVNGYQCYGAVELEDEGTLPLNEPLWKHG